ncbi:MAG: GatB/YqeY domain-containing protein [Alphaproteobacteria bacterium]|nr:GatB/YqeY domain-containing protein [Alphaproteobacteria bacterium]
MLRDDIKNALVDAMKNKDQEKVNTLRLVQAAIKQKDIDARVKGVMDGVDEATVLSLLQGMIKQRKESIEMYKKGGRDDLVSHEQAEVDIIQGFLPKQMDEIAMTEAIKIIIAETGAASIKDMGKVMGALRAKYAGQMDFGVASGVIKTLLAG